MLSFELGRLDRLSKRGRPRREERKRVFYCPSNSDIAAKRREKHKNPISELVNSMCYNEQKLKFRLFTNPTILIVS